MDRNIIERIKMIKAMEYIARQINNEDVFELWLMCGVADGDISYGSLEITADDVENLSYYVDPINFAELMDLFLRVMKYALKDGGLYCGDIVSKEGN